jgi:hypothetical protein
MEPTLVLKLVLVPVLIGFVSMAEHRWGPAVSGWLIGLPLTAAPVVLILALEQGIGFAIKTSQGTILGYISQGVFCLVYAWLSSRYNWPSTVLLGWGAFFTVTVALNGVSVPLIICFTGVVAFLLLILKLFPKTALVASRRKASSWQIPIRILAATAMVLLITAFAAWLGPQLSGLLVAFPVYATVLAVSIQRSQGATPVVQLLHGIVVGSFTAATFFLAVAAIMGNFGIFLAFALAIVISLAIHGCSFKMLANQRRFKAASNGS